MIPWTLRPATLDDLPEAVAMFNLCAQEMRGRDETSVEEYLREWQDPALDLERDTRLAVAPDGAVVGCVELWHVSPFITAWAWGRVHPEWRGRGIGTALLAWAEARAREQLPHAPAGARVVVQAASLAGFRPALELLEDRGFEPIRHSWILARDLGERPPPPAWAGGVAVRAMGQGDEEAVYRAQVEAFRDHWGFFDEPFEAGFARWRHRLLSSPGYDPALCFLAVDGAEIAGLSLCLPRTGEDALCGWVETLGVRRPWRRRGIGLALLYHSFAELRRRGCRRVALSVDAGSLTGATRLYERAGMLVERELVLYEKELRQGVDIALRSLDDVDVRGSVI